MPEVAIIGVGLHPFGRYPGKSALTMGAEAARLRYAQTEELAIELHEPKMLMSILNNYAYTELGSFSDGSAIAIVYRLR